MLALKIDRDYYIPYLPSSEFNLRSDVPTIADMKIITATTMPITTEARPQESTMIRRYTWEIFPANQVVARSWRGKCKLCIKMTDKFDIKIICIFVFFILQFLFQISKFRPNRKATLKGLPVITHVTRNNVIFKIILHTMTSPIFSVFTSHVINTKNRN